MRILIVEDDPVMSTALIMTLRRANHAVTHQTNGKLADHMLLTHQFDLVILDISLPGMDGIEILRRLRHRREKVPVLMLTARDTIEDRILGLDFGADDYLIKPFNLAELEARIRALLRRGQSASDALLKLGLLSLDTVGCRATVNNKPLDLSSRELSVLELLMLRVNKVVSKEQLCMQLSDMGEEISYNAVEVLIHRLRRKIKSAKVTIRTLYGLGYMLEQVTPD